MRFNIWLFSILMASHLATMLLFWLWVLRPWTEDIDRRWRKLHQRRALLAIELAPHARDCPKSDDPSDWALNLPSASCVCHIHDLREFTLSGTDYA